MKIYFDARTTELKLPSRGSGVGWGEDDYSDITRIGMLWHIDDSGGIVTLVTFSININIIVNRISSRTIILMYINNFNNLCTQCTQF